MEHLISKRLLRGFFGKLEECLEIDAAIVGAGPSGLICAWDLARAGKRVAVFERTRELGVMRALGLTPGQLLRLVLIESVLLTAVAGVFGLALGGVLDYWVITEGLDFSAVDGKGLVYQGITLDPRIKGEFNLDGVLLTIAVMFSISVLSAVWPAVRAARLRPVDAMRHV